jgi:ribosome-associated heat shock protein Hsp15
MRSPARSHDKEDDDGEAGARLDVWLWRARFFKTRSIATRFVETGRVRVTRSGAVLRGRKPGFVVAAGDIVTFARGGRVMSAEILAIPLRRGPASEARGLYRALDMGDTDSPS